jgi:hypothetical protein
MGVKLTNRLVNRLSSLLLAAASTTLVATTAAQAQEREVFQVRNPIPGAMDDAFFDHTKSLLQATPATRGRENIFGTFYYPENAVTKDANSIVRLYNYLYSQQTSSDPTVRTTDLVSPFNTSVLTMPTTKASRNPNGDFVYDRTPEAMPGPITPTPELPPMPRRPVPAKF